jgi:hypothetical protein
MRVEGGRTPGLDAPRRFPEVRVRKRPNCQSWKIEARSSYAPSAGNALSPESPYSIQRRDYVRGFWNWEAGKEALDYVAEELGNDLEFRHSMWRLDILQEPKLNAMAAPALAEADLLLISLREDRQFPAKIRALIDERLAQTANHDCALVALFESTPSVMRSSVYACLANLARQHLLDCFEQALTDSGDREEPSLDGEPSLKLVWVF